MALRRFAAGAVLAWCLAPMAGARRITTEVDESGPSTGFWAWLGDDSIQINASAAEAKIRRQSPGVLAPREAVAMAFKVGRNKVYFTDHRIVLRPKSFWTGKKVTYHSVPYESIKAYTIQTAGMWPDMENDLVLYTNLPGRPTIRLGFRKGNRAEKVDIYDVGRFFAEKIMGLRVPALEGGALLDISANASANGTQRWLGDSIAWLGGNAAQINAEDVERDLRKSVALLGEHERVLMAFKVGRDTTLLTSRRLMRIDVKGISGTCVNYQIIPYEVIKAFTMQTAGTLDFDAELRVWTEVPGITDFKQDLRAGRANVKGIQLLLSDKVLGVTSPGGQRESSLAQFSNDGPVMDIFHWLGNNHMQVDPVSAEEYVRHHGVLQARGEEWVLMAFSVGRDMNLLTNKRLLMIDIKGFGKKVEYKTVPYHAMHAFAVQTAGYFDGDAELMIWTKITPPPPIPRKQQREGQPPPPSPPPQCPTVSTWDDCLSYVTFDLAAGRADVLGIQELLSAFVLGFPAPAEWGIGGTSMVEGLSEGPHRDRQHRRHRRHRQHLAHSTASPLSDLYHYLDNNAAQVNPTYVERLFKAGRILQHDETVQLAFRLGGDWHLWTSKRFLLVDRKGWFDSDRKVLFRSIPYAAIRGFAVTSAGMWDLDAELEFWTDMPWLRAYRQDLRAGQVDLRQILMMLGRELTGFRPPPGRADALLEGSPIKDFVGWMHGYAYEVDAAEANREFHEEKPILLPGEEVRLSYKIGRDTILLTTKRALRVDVQGLSGTRVNYKSVPYASVGSFFVRSAGSLELDSEMQLFTDMPGFPLLQQSFRHDLADIFKASRVLTQGVFEAFGWGG